ncbi:Putative signal transduction response regulator, receiver domain, histidine kinase/HSP90-like ATPase [Septoria linicola]|uniref:histidine kinase n=1 Tax=Septoria linicola TaxID=215465 RepID=A0A9Q9EJ01_9PEZI|nr:putative signal transduction response regulator, receiver domain, histidine kinase/HSP90-like ATPase [Septoria linicola]USW51659.1 Putative signal transduction response regulator, receiver domain, histidine kinase/HSP90-like ATPase [Septoria linicola]
MPPLDKKDSGVDVVGNMASHGGKKSDSPRRKMLYESRRAREFYRYYQPIRELTKAGPPTCDIGNDQAVQSHRPLSCPDRALTAFCQLGALRMGTKRAMLFFFDSTNAYVLAESTRTLSLQDDSKHAADDDLWLGHSIIPRGYSVCEHTIMLPANAGTNKDDTNSSLIHIVNDLAEDTRFCDRPFVKAGPKAKFYAGVPITTPRGINIGAYCVLDDEPRQGLDVDSVNFMRDMATTVMTHLEMVRATAEHKIGTKMVAGLGAFIDGASGLRDWASRNADWNLEDIEQDPAMQHPLGVQPMTSPASAVAATAVAVGEQEKEAERATNSSSNSPHRRHRSRSSATGLAPPMTGPPQALKYRRSAEKLEDPEVSSKQSTFDRAARLVREAMDVEGVMFLDAAVGTFGGLIETVESGHNSTTHTEMSSDNHQSAADANTTGTDGETKTIKKTTGEDLSQKQCQVLAASCALSPATKTELENVQQATEAAMKCHEQITEKFLRSLLRRYPRGKIWSFNEFGDASSDDDESSEYNSDAKSCHCSSGTKIDGKQTHAPSCSKRRKYGRRDDCTEILKLFPGVRSFGLVGMWDNTRQRWYAASLFWTYSPLRLFSEESEVKYMAAFCDVILAELHRIEAQTSDRAKSDFISTISHELRSPLHGILGSVECLQESEFDSFNANLISQVEICGRTLLDIIDHLLDFSKINHHAKSSVPRMIDGQGRKMSANASKRSRMGGLMSLDVDVALDQVTEEVVETAVYSFCCSRDAETVLRRRVAVILDIDRAPDIDWRCCVALGAWKRICINLVSNALKYTREGHIRVSLKASPLPDKNKKKRFNVTFSVHDTGRGMSRDFLENHLFRAFAQEDSLVEGTGLGMNLVAKIVKSFEGKIEVLSEKGVGSCFSVTLPLEHSRTKREGGARNPARPLHRSISGMSRAVAGCAVGVIDCASTPSGNQRADETARALLLSSVHKTLDEVGVNAYNVTWQGDEAADVYLVTEAELQNELSRRQEVGCLDGPMSPSAVSNKPFIVLCESTVSARRLRTPGLGNIANGYIELIAQPAGPERLVKAISSCMKHKRGVARDLKLAGAVSDIPAMVPHPDPAGPAQRPALVHRGRNDTIVDRSPQQERKSSSLSSGDNAEDRERADPTKLERKLSSDYKFPRIPTPSLNGSKPRVSTGNNSPKQTSPKAERSKKTDGGVSLLLVDDNPVNLQLLVTYAEKLGHRKIVATDGQQAVDSYQQAALEAEEKGETSSNVAKGEAPIKPQVILMDINMPKLNGFEATRAIRAFEKQKGLEAATIIALTGLGSASAQQEAFSSGVDLFLTKPVRLKELTNILNGTKQ